MSRPLALAALLLTLPLAGPTLAKPDPEAARTVEGVRAVEAHWLKAFLGGDEAYLDRLLDPAYVSVGQAGTPRPKAQIIALAKKMAASPPKPMAPLPPAQIVVHGDAAVVTNSNGGDTSVDVFYWAGGRWHAWHSQHTPVKAQS
ncbi:MAG: nuclear transport factor 2 family protein [Proteobacteria bacterium]|nr:nuclear transport factor 2 family protein [Pseudomonadota bacterium]